MTLGFLFSVHSNSVSCSPSFILPLHSLLYPWKNYTRVYMYTHSRGFFQQHTDTKSIQTHLAPLPQSPTQWMTSVVEVKDLRMILSTLVFPPPSLCPSLSPIYWFYPQVYLLSSISVSTILIKAHHLLCCSLHFPCQPHSFLWTRLKWSVKIKQIRSLSFCIRIKCKVRLCMI